MSPTGGWLLDLLVGASFLVGGVVGRVRRPASRTGPLLAATGLAWFLGTAAEVGLVGRVSAALLFLHRGVLLHTVVSFASGRLVSPVDRVVVAAGYLAALTSVGRLEVVAVGVWVVAAGVTASGMVAGAADRRWDRRVAWMASSSVALVLAGAAAARTFLPSALVDPIALHVYQLVLAGVAVGLTSALIRDRSGRVADQVVELTGEEPTGLSDALAVALQDPTVEVAYRVPGERAFVTADGRPLTLPADGSGRSVTPVVADGETVALVVHDPAVLDDPQLAAAVAAVVRLTSANVALRADLREQIAEVEASRRRLLEAGDDERGRLQRRLAAGARTHLEVVLDRLTTLATLADGERPVRDERRDSQERARQQAERALGDLDDLARGLHPLARGVGLEGSLQELVDHATVPTTLQVRIVSLPDHVAAAAYFVVSEALANATKHADADEVAVTVEAAGGGLRVVVADDGVGGSTLDGGTGLQGLADRIEGLGGQLVVESPPGGGTRLVAELPIGAP
jgi:signal transduction histidine kinase